MPVWRFRVLAALLVVLAAPLQAAGAPQRIVSLNLCADQYLLALADRGQIAGLSRFARDRALSAVADKAGGIPPVGHSAEKIVAVGPDLVVGGGEMAGVIDAALPRGSFRYLTLNEANGFDEIRQQIRKVAQAVGHPQRGERLIRKMEEALSGLPPAGAGRVAAYYQRRGYLTGAGTLIDELMARNGLVNLAGRLGRPALSRLSIEELLVARPDILIVETLDAGPNDLGTAVLRHPALADIPRVAVPQAWTVCGGPYYVEAAKSMAAQLRAIEAP